MKKKLVIMSEALGGGVRRHIIDLIENIDKNIFEIYFIYNLDRADSIIKEKISYMKKNGINLIEIEKFNREIGFNDIKAYRSIYRELKKIKPDIVHCHSSKAGALGRIAAKKLGVKQIYYTPHAYYFQNPDSSKLKKNIYIFLESILSRYFTTKTINVSHGERKIALDYKLDKEEKFIVIYNGIEKNNIVSESKRSILMNEFNIAKDDIVVGVIARLNKQKDPDTFIDIAKFVLSKYDKVKFIYVGDGELYNHINDRINKLNLNKNIILTGFRKDTEDILDIFDIFLTTALYEGMPYALIEASRAKLPIIATNITGNNEIVKNNENGYLFNRYDIEDESLKIINIIKDKNKLLEMSNKSYEFFENDFTINIMIDKYEKLYNTEVM